MSAQQTAIRPVESGTQTALEQLVLKGDLASLTSQQRVAYYVELCRSLGLNPASRPFDYLELNRKTVLYARKDATDQLRSIRGVSICRLEKEQVGDLYVVTAYARSADGREDADMGAVPVKGLQGEALANAILKAITKAKRRVTLSICGLGMLDETELQSIPDARPVHVNPETGEIIEQPARVAAPAPNGNGEKPKKLLPLPQCRDALRHLFIMKGFGDDEADDRVLAIARIEDESDQRKAIHATAEDLKSGSLTPAEDFADPFGEEKPK